MLNFLNDSYIVVSCEERTRCKSMTLHGQCTNMADWQVKRQSCWKPVCHIHMRKIVIEYRKSESTERHAVKVKRVYAWTWLLWPGCFFIWKLLQHITDIYS